MPCRFPASRPPRLLSGSIFTAPNVERQRPSARVGSICCAGGGPLWLGGPENDWFWFELDVADPAAATHAARTATTRATFPALIAASIAPRRFTAARDRASGVVDFLQPDSVPAAIRAVVHSSWHPRRGPIAQSVRAAGSYPGGPWFEPRWPH